MGIFDTVTTLARAYHPSPQHIRLSITLTLVAFALANIITLFRALRSSDSFSAVLTNPWPSATFIDIFAGFVLSIPYLIAHSPHGLPLSLPTLFLLPSIPLLYSTAFLPTFLPFAPGTALSPSRPHVLALRYTATATLAITTIAFLNAWIRQSPGVGWDVVEGNKWAGAVFVADLCGMLFTGLYVGKREEWRWRVVVPAWIAVFVFGNSFACAYVILCTFGTTSIQEALLTSKPILGARWPFVNSMAQQEGEGVQHGHYEQLDDGLDV